MKFVFNDSLMASVLNNDIEDPIVNFVSSDIILERKLVTAATINTVEELLEALKNVTSEIDQKNILKSPDAIALLNDPEKRLEFLEKWKGGSSKSKPSNSGDDPVSMMNEMLLGGAEQVGQAGSKFAPFISQKDQIIARLKPFMSDVDIGEIFKRFLEDIKLPFTEVIGILEFLIQNSRSCNAKVKDLIDFYLEHYKQKLQGANTKNIIKLACEYHKLNPTVDIFSVLKDAVAGNQPKVNLGYLSIDPNSQLIFNNLIELSQSSLPEQSEEIRRRFQSSRDALENQQQKVNMQTAIYDMMKTEEMNLQLVKIIGSLGDAFKFLITQPMFRALKDMFYDLRAGGIIMNQATSIFGANTSPNEKRLTYFEQQTEREEVFSQIPDTKQPFSSYNQYNFLKLASPDVTRHIYAQTAPAGTPTATPQQKQLAENSMSSFLSKLKEVSSDIIKQIKDAAEKILDIVKSFIEGFLVRIIAFFKALFQAFENIFTLLKQGKITGDALQNEFRKVLNVIMNNDSVDSGSSVPTTSNSSSSKNSGVASGAANIALKPPLKSNFQYQKIAQKSPQRGTTYSGGSRAVQYTDNAIGLIGSLGVGILAVTLVPRLFSAMLKSGDFSSIVNIILPLTLGIKNNVIEMFMTLNLVGGQAPQSNVFLDNNGNLTPNGTQMLANNRETMIALGASDEDAMIFGKFAVQKVYYMEQMRTKETNLKNAESQAVQTGNPNSPETTVGDLPADFQKKLKDFLDFGRKVEVEFKANINLFKTGIGNLRNLDQAQKLQSEGLLAVLQKDLIEIQSKISEWSSMKNIAGHMIRKRVLLQKIKPLQTQLDTMRKLGIPMSNIIASPNGLLAQIGRIRFEEQQALDKLRKEFYEKMDILKNPDKIAPFTKYPTSTGVTKLPESPDQSPSTESPFDTQEDSEFTTGAK